MNQENFEITRKTLTLKQVKTKFHIPLKTPNEHVKNQGRIEDFLLFGGGGGGGGWGRKRLCARTYITSVKPEVPYGRGQGYA